MVAYWFYHLEHSSLEAILPDILEKIRQRGWRALLKVGSCHGSAQAEAARIDTYLWTYRQNSFLPHGRDDQPFADRQPLLISTDAKTVDNREVVVLVNGAEIEDVASARRCITILDGRNGQDRQIARQRWKNAKTAGFETAYWKQDEHGRWIQPDI